MKNKLKEKWLHLYELADMIAAMSPWEDFEEKNRFTYIWKDKSKAVHFSFISTSAQKLGIACYIGDENYARSRARLTAKNEKQEPVFMLQNALICLWDDRNNIRKKSYELIKELGFKFRGKGAWLHFERYELGYLPDVPSEEDVDFLTTAFENLIMMLRAIYEQGLDPEFDKGKSLIRWYEPKDKLYYTHPFEIEITADSIPRLLVTVQDNDKLQDIRSMNSAGYDVEIDRSYVDAIYEDEDGKETYPCLILAVEHNTGNILIDQILSPKQNNADTVFNIFIFLVEHYGKPREVFICDNDLMGILEDLCKKVGIKLTVKNRLLKLNQARNKLLPQI